MFVTLAKSLMLILKFPQMIDAETLEKASDEELKSLCEELLNDIGLINDELRSREMSKYNYEGRYIKYYDCNGDGPTSMYVRHAFLTNRYGNSADIELCLQGHGFEYEIGPYTDSTYFNYSCLEDIYVNVQLLLEREQMRKSFDEKDGGMNESNKLLYNSYRIVEITKEEFKQAFNEMYNRLPNLFNEMIERDEETQQDENND